MLSMLHSARRWLPAVLAVGALLPLQARAQAVHPALRSVNPAFLPSGDEIQAWHRFKDEGGPTYSGSPAWHRYVSFVEERLKNLGVVGLTRNEWRYDQWTTSDWPDASKWTLVSGSVCAMP